MRWEFILDCAKLAAAIMAGGTLGYLAARHLDTGLQKAYGLVKDKIKSEED